MPPNPVTHSTPAQLEEAERIFNVEEEVEKLADAGTMEEIGGQGGAGDRAENGR